MACCLFLDASALTTNVSWLGYALGHRGAQIPFCLCPCSPRSTSDSAYGAPQRRVGCLWKRTSEEMVDATDPCRGGSGRDGPVATARP
eukprot:353695-Chlamydomonas_euryale.AAC.7